MLEIFEGKALKNEYFLKLDWLFCEYCAQLEKYAIIALYSK